jgi:2-polyprenyl-6-methoxyphenol hydroxylase-like FAD-dependent oxidoreductase
MDRHSRTQAIVIGGSIAGLLAARAAAPYFDRVTIIERDALPEAATLRPGTPQARHIHTLLARGYRAIDSLLPGITEDLDDMGAPFIHWGWDTAAVTPFGLSARVNTGVGSYGVTRAGLEAAIRRRVLALPQVSALTNCQVLGLRVIGGRVRGVQIREKHSDAVMTLAADLVIDTSGRNSEAPKWLQAHGYSLPEETFVPSTVAYATRWYRRPDVAPEWKALSIRSRPTAGQNRGGLIMEVEGDDWMVLLSGYNGEQPSNDNHDFLEYARSLASSHIYDAIKDLDPQSPIYGYRFAGSRWRHYERMGRMPEHFILLGDAVCSFNPIYGQGMTVAAMEAECLAQMLSRRDVRDLSGFAGQFQRRVADMIREPWALATAEDKRLVEGAESHQSLRTRLMRAYRDAVVTLVPVDAVISRAFVRVANLLSSPTTLLHPRIVWRVILQTLQGRMKHPLRHMGAEESQVSVPVSAQSTSAS